MMVRKHKVAGMSAAKFKNKAVVLAVGAALGAVSGVSLASQEITSAANSNVGTGAQGWLGFTGATAIVGTVSDGAIITSVTTLNTGIGSLNFQGSATVVSGGTAAARLGTIAAGAAGSTVTFASGSHITAATVSSTGSLVFAELTANTVSFAGNGSVTIASGSLYGNISTTASTATGTLNLLGVTTAPSASLVGGTPIVGTQVSILGTVGSSTAGLLRVNVGDSSNATVTSGTIFFGGQLFTNQLNFASDITATVTSGTIGAVTAGSNGTGTLLVAGTTNFGSVGASGTALKVFQAAGTGFTTTVTGAIFANTVSLQTGSTVSVTSGTVGTIFSNNVASGTAGTSATTVSVLGNFTVSGATTVSFLGAGANGTTVSLIGNAVATNVSSSGTGTVQFNSLTLAGGLNFAGAGTVSIASGTITGAVTSTTGTTTGVGTLTLLGGTGNQTITGSVGTTSSRLLAVNAGVTGSTGATAFNGGLFANSLTIAGSGVVSVVSGTIGTITTANGSSLNLNAAANDLVSVTGTLGGSTASGTLNTGGTANTGYYSFTGAAVATSASLGGTTTFTGGLTATTVSVLGTANFVGGLTATTVSVAGTGTINIGASGSTTSIGSTLVNGASVVGNTPVGTLNFLGSTTISSAIGGTVSLAAVTFSGTSATVNIGAAINATATTVTGTATAIYKTGGTAHLGSVTIGHAATLDLAALATTSSGTLTVVNTGVAAGGTIKTTVTSGALAGTAGKLTLTGAATIPAASKVYVDVPTSITVVDGSTILVVDGFGGTGVATITTGNVTTNSAVLSFSGRAGTGGVISATTGEDLYVIATRLSGGFTAAAGISASAPAAGAISVLNAIAAAGTATGDMLTVANTFNTFSAAQLATELPKLAPLPASAAGTAAGGAASAGLNSVSSRLASLRGDTLLADANSVGTGIAGGDKGRDQAFWIKAFGSTGKQTAYDGFNGYGADSAGFAFGADTDVAGDWRVGGAFTYADTTVSMNDAARGDRTKVKTQQLAVYGMKEMGDSYVDTMLAYAVHKNDSLRNTALSRIATANYDANQWTLRVGGGYRMPMSGGTVVTPLAALEYTSLMTNTYTESGAGALNLRNESKTTSGFKSSLGARVSGDSNWGGTAIKPEAHVLWAYNFGDEKVDSTSTFTGGGAAFNTIGQKIDRNSYNLGGGIAFLPNKTSKITVVYDYDTRKNYGGHAVSLTGRWNF